MELNLFSIILLVSGLLVAGISSVLISQHTGVIRWFALTMLLVSVWSLAYGFELSSQGLERMLFWIKIEYIGIALLRFRLFDIKPIFRDKVIESLDKGILVIDPKNRIVDINPFMSALLNLRRSKLVGKRLEEVFPQQTVFSQLKDHHSQEWWCAPY